MVRNFFGIVFLVLSGFLVYNVGFLAFLDVPDVGSKKFLVVGGFCIPLILSHLIGLALYRGDNWKTATGVTFLTGSALNAFIILMVFVIRESSEIAAVIDTGTLDDFNDYVSGFGVMAFFIGSGFAFYRAGRSVDKTGESVGKGVA